MRKTKLVIAFLILFITVGIAAVTTSVFISGSTQLASNPSDFQVYFSNVLVNGKQDLSLVQSKNSLYFSNVLNEVGESYVISYDVTNASKSYDADISISCTQGNEYISIVNEFDSSSFLSATSTRSGVLTISLKKTYAGEAELVHDVSCTIDSEAVERTSQGGGTVPTPLTKYYVGREISIGEEKFNIINENNDTVTMLAQYNIDSSAPYKQTTKQIWTTFSDSGGWEYTPGPKEIDVQIWSDDAKILLNNYVNYLNTEYNVFVIGDFITVSELGDLGCVYPIGNSMGDLKPDDFSCNNLEYSDWLVNGQSWWTRSADSGYSYGLYVILDDGFFDHFDCDDSYGVRPIVTISKTTVDELIEKESYRTYEVGEVITIDTESFNVISDNGDTVTMLAQDVLSSSLVQCTLEDGENCDVIWAYFSYENGWEYTPGPKEIEVRNYSSDVASYLDSYQSYLREFTGDETLSTDLITLSKLGELGCTISEDYTPVDGLTCESSSYASWLINNRWFWTKSAYSNDSGRVWVVNPGGLLYSEDWSLIGYYSDDSNGVRPVVTISKEYLPE